MIAGVPGLTVVASGVSLVLMLANKLLVNQTKMKGLKDNMNFHKKKYNEAQKSKDMKAMSEHTNRMLDFNKQYMSSSMKPMLASGVIVLTVFPWMANVFKSVVVALPFAGLTVPWGWLGWYFAVSISSTLVFKKLLGVQ